MSVVPIEYSRISAAFRAHLYRIHLKSHNSPAHRACINLKIGIYVVLDSKGIHKKKFLDTLSDGELWATSVPKLGKIGDLRRQRQSHSVNQPLISRFGHINSF